MQNNQYDLFPGLISLKPYGQLNGEEKLRLDRIGATPDQAEKFEFLPSADRSVAIDSFGWCCESNAQGQTNDNAVIQFLIHQRIFIADHLSQVGYPPYTPKGSDRLAGILSLGGFHLSNDLRSFLIRWLILKEPSLAYSKTYQVLKLPTRKSRFDPLFNAGFKPEDSELVDHLTQKEDR